MPINFLIKCLISSEHFARFVFQNKLMAFNESNLWTLMFQKGVKKGALPARTVSPLMSINFWTIREQFVFEETICIPNKNNSCPPKNESRFDEPIHEHWWSGKRKERAEKSNNFERFFSDSTLTFLTFENTFRLPILPTRHIVFLCLPLIKIWGRQI